MGVNIKPTPSLSTSVCLQQNDVAMKALNVCNSDSIVECNRNKSVSSSETSNSTTSSSSSRKRKMNFDDDDEDDMVQKPPAKKQKSDPNQGIQKEKISPMIFGSATSHSI